MRRRKADKKCLWALLSTVILCLNLVGCQDSELIAEQLKQPIKMAGSISDYVAMDKDNRVATCDNQHIEISGTVSDTGFTLFEVGDKKQDGMVISCTFDEHSDALEAIEEGDFVRIQGVCMGCYTDSMFVYGCSLVEHTKADESITESAPETTEESVSEIEKITEQETEEETVQEPEETTVEVVETQEAEETVVAENPEPSVEEKEEPQPEPIPEPEPAPELEPEPIPEPAPEPMPEPEPEPIQQAVPEPQQELAIQAESASVPEPEPQAGSGQNYIVNKNSGAIHSPSCSRLPKEKNRIYYGTLEEVYANGYTNLCDYCLN